MVGKTPYEAGNNSGRKPSLRHLRVFECLAFVHVPKEKRNKLGCRATPGIFVGYSATTKQYQVYDPVAKQLHLSRDVVFRENRRYTAPYPDDEGVLRSHFYREILPDTSDPAAAGNKSGVQPQSTHEVPQSDSPDLGSEGESGESDDDVAENAGPGGPAAGNTGDGGPLSLT